MKTLKPIALVFGLLLLPASTILAEGLLPARYKITDDGLKITRSFDPTLQVGDVITHAEGQKVKPRLAAGLMNRLKKKKNELTLTISRGEKTVEHKVKLMSQDDFNQALEADAAKEKEKKAKKEEEELEQWFATNKPKDSSGRAWSLKEINAHNDPLTVEITRIIRKHRDAEQDHNASHGEGHKSLGGEISSGLGTIQVLEMILQAPEGKPYKLNRREMVKNAAGFPLYEKAVPVACPTLDDAAGFLTDYNCKTVEKLFDFTDAENYLIWCRNGEVITANEAWLKVVTNSTGAKAAKEKEEELEQWFATNKPKDSSGRVWSLKEINAHNDPLTVEITRIIRKHRDAEQDHNASHGEGHKSLGGEISSGLGTIQVLEMILQAPEGKPYKQKIEKWDVDKGWYDVFTELRTLEEASSIVTDNDFKYVERLFDFTDAENYLIWCRNGEVITANEAWLKVVTNSVSK
jgi:hypothetical protein